MTVHRLEELSQTITHHMMSLSDDMCIHIFSLSLTIGECTVDILDRFWAVFRFYFRFIFDKADQNHILVFAQNPK